MDKVINNYFEGHNRVSAISSIQTSQEDIMKSKILNLEIDSLDLTNIENISSKSSLVSTDSTECLSKDSDASNSLTLKFDSNVSPTASKIASPKTLKITPPRLLKDLGKPKIEVEELLELINLEKEDTEEILDMISRAKEKLEFFISHAECLVKSLKENSELKTINNARRNTYVKKMYRRKLEEFASSLLIKVKKSTKVLEIEYNMLKEQERKIVETHEMISECIRNSDHVEKKGTSLIETVGQLLETMYSMKSKQLMEIKEVSYIEMDVEMLYDLYRRFSSIEGLNLMSTFSFMQQSC